MLKWEKIPTDRFEIWRAAVPGGWFVSTYYPVGTACVTGLAFYPDPEHRWSRDNSLVPPVPPPPANR